MNNVLIPHFKQDIYFLSKILKKPFTQKTEQGLLEEKRIFK